MSHDIFFLIFLLLFFYIVDCFKAVNIGDAIIEIGFNKRLFYFNSFKFGKKYFVFINPFTAHRLTLRSSLRIDKFKNFSPEKLIKDPHFRCLMVSQSIQLILVAIIVPLLLYKNLTYVSVGILILSYLNLCFIAYISWQFRASMNFSRGVFLKSIVNSILCIPYSINFLRNLSLNQENILDLQELVDEADKLERVNFAFDLNSFVERNRELLPEHSVKLERLQNLLEVKANEL